MRPGPDQEVSVQDLLKFHVQRLVEKLGVSDRTEAAYRAAELDLVDED